MKITLSQFKGTAPKFHPEQLADNYAVSAVNVRTGRDLLEPWRGSSILASILNPSVIKSISRYLNKWFSWTQPTYMIRAPIPNDPWDFAIIAGVGVNPNVTYNAIAETGVGPYPATTHPLGVPRPKAVVSLVIGVSPQWYVNDPTTMPPITGGLKPDRTIGVDEYDVSSTSYILVYVDAWGRLSDVSDPSNIISIREFDLANTNEVTITLPSPPTGLLLSDAIRGSTAKLRIYRANYGLSGSGVYQFVAEVSAITPLYKDSQHSSTLQEAPMSEGWAMPPSLDTSLYPNGPMEKIVIVGTDLIAGHNKKIVCFAEPQFYYAYPTKYYQVFEYGVVTIESLGSMLVVLTERYPYVLQGAHPRAMSLTRLSNPAPCANPLAVTELLDSVYFSSPIGLFRVKGFTLVNVGLTFLTEREWLSLGPSTMVFTSYASKLFISCPSVGVTYVLDPQRPADGFMSVDMSPVAVFPLPISNDLAYVGSKTPTSSSIDIFDSSSTRRLLDWHSKTFAFNSPTSFSVIKVDAASYPVTVSVHMLKLNGNMQVYDSVVTSSRFQYIPVMGASYKWSFSVKALSPTESIEIRRIQVAQSPMELS